MWSSGEKEAVPSEVYLEWLFYWGKDCHKTHKLRQIFFFFFLYMLRVSLICSRHLDQQQSDFRSLTMHYVEVTCQLAKNLQAILLPFGSWQVIHILPVINMNHYFKNYSEKKETDLFIF